jgi:hypothetical protein
MTTAADALSGGPGKLRARAEAETLLRASAGEARKRTQDNARDRRLSSIGIVYIPRWENL